ncbi:MAG: FHA domain-containing protein [Candidatus Promineifilaceae bacterium]|nr:FHA domain-containing protein [Candidatus Promineifilaceae bacterium]
MIRCSECNALIIPGALYCNECGASLLGNGEMREAQPFVEKEAEMDRPRLVGQEMNPTVEAEQITFFIPFSGRRIRLPLQPQIRIGRTDPSAGHEPELDLTDDGGVGGGVSRCHADIQFSGEGVVIIDRDSTNGTYLNGYRLPPELPYPLHSGDEIRLGELLVHVFIE